MGLFAVVVRKVKLGVRVAAYIDKTRDAAERVPGLLRFRRDTVEPLLYLLVLLLDIPELLLQPVNPGLVLRHRDARHNRRARQDGPDEKSPHIPYPSV